jgi:hypothetical protein
MIALLVHVRSCTRASWHASTALALVTYLAPITLLVHTTAYCLYRWLKTVGLVLLGIVAMCVVKVTVISSKSSISGSDITANKGLQKAAKIIDKVSYSVVKIKLTLTRDHARVCTCVHMC